MFVDFEALGMTLPFHVSFPHAPLHQKLQCSLEFWPRSQRYKQTFLLHKPPVSYISNLSFSGQGAR